MPQAWDFTNYKFGLTLLLEQLRDVMGSQVAITKTIILLNNTYFLFKKKDQISSQQCMGLKSIKCFKYLLLKYLSVIPSI